MLQKSTCLVCFIHRSSFLVNELELGEKFHHALFTHDAVVKKGITVGTVGGVKRATLIDGLL